MNLAQKKQPPPNEIRAKLSKVARQAFDRAEAKTEAKQKPTKAPIDLVSRLVIKSLNEAAAEAAAKGRE